MGTLAEVVVADHDVGRARTAIEAALDELRWVGRVMSRFDKDSDVGRINTGAVGEPVRVTAATAAVVSAGLRWADASDGRFDPGLARAVALWSVGHRDVPPPAEAVSRFAGRGLYRELEVAELDTEAPVTQLGSSSHPVGPLARSRSEGAVVLRRHADVGVDLGGIAKGYAVDRAAAALRRHGVRNGMVNAGGDLYALGRSPDGDPWKVGIRSSRDPSRLAGEIEVTDRAVATSGDYEQSFEHDGRLYHHLLDPETGEPRRSSTHSLTVTAVDCLTADAAATACFGLPRREARRLLSGSAAGATLVGGATPDRPGRRASARHLQESEDGSEGLAPTHGVLREEP
jgi:thiamine biosynthesis lipoprotein